MIASFAKKYDFRLNVIISLCLFLQIQFFSITSAVAQNGINPDTIRRCYTDYMTRLMKNKFPVVPAYSLGSSSSIDKSTYFIIPVVVHVIHMGGEENISDELIKSQIEVMNEDYGHYGKTDTDPRGTDTKIRFCLAKKDPQGNPSTGIERIFSQYTDLNSSDESLTKSLSTWDPNKYLNFWVVRSIDGSSNIQAYAYMPSNSGGPSFDGDGVVVIYKYFGCGGNFSSLYNLGKTCVHESGHYFDLMHTWGGDGPGQGGCDDDDGIDDTPVCSLDYYSSPVTNCFHPIQCGNTRMIENFLDYSLDGCLSIFTAGQAKKMISAIYKYRSVLVSSQNMSNCGCNYMYDSLNNIMELFVYPSLVTGEKLYLEVKNIIAAPLSFSIYDIYGRLYYSKSYDNVTKSTFEIPLIQINDHLRPGVYIITGRFGSSFQRKFVVANPR